jgi:hypothetical protein
LEALTQRLARLEESSSHEIVDYTANHHITSSTSSSPSANLPTIAEVCKDKQKRHREFVSQEITPLQPPASKRRKSQTVAQQNVHQVHSPGSTHHASEAREYIEHELQCNPALSKDRRTALESAQNFVNQLSNPALHWEETAAMDNIDAEDKLEPPNLTPELLYMMLPGR